MKEVIDNFLDEKYFEHLANLFTDNKEKMGNSLVPWYFQQGIAYSGETEGLFFYMTHKIYDKNVPNSDWYKDFLPLLDKLEIKSLIRIKVNLYPNTHILHEHPMHVDFPFSHSSALLSLNTCDGYTKLNDGTKIDSIANRLLLFDAGEGHCSTTTTNVPARFNININYF